MTSGTGAPGRFDYCPWLFRGSASEEERQAQLAWQQGLVKRLVEQGGEAELAGRTFVSPWAGVFTDRLRMGEGSYVAAYAYVTDDVEMGRDCTVNPFATVRGRVRLGDHVRIGAHSSVLGFNHSTAPDRPVHKQPLTSAGIVIGDDVWIGSGVVVVDGVTIGDHCVIGAGAVVTRDLPPWSVAAGNPARRLRDRREVPARRAVPQGLDARLERFADRAREQAAELLGRCRAQGPDGVPAFADRPGAPRTVRAVCDAVEIAQLLLGAPPPGTTAEELAALLRGLQDPGTGLVPEFGAAPPALDDDAAMYHILCVGYALDLLGSGFAHPVRAVHALDPAELRARLDGLPWRTAAWRSGHWVDGIGTAYLRNIEGFGLYAEAADTLFGWLLTHADPWHGMWGRPGAADRWLQPVNGFYRLTRGTFAQFGLPLPYPERAVDTVLAHSRDTAFFGPDRGNACNVLDVIHPLWLCARQSGHRLAEGQEWAREQLGRLLDRWQDGEGFSFALEPGGTREQMPGLQGTEMWLAIAWLLADHLGISGALGYRPAGVHRPEPVRKGLTRPR
ncbi:DapH/DapD/GlmU-related protein [Streptomyces sp. FIT100]|uniref:acyltransferase n=1 Tax=Streptomyces sp. FIT100 TaxID=2837956 RepID=UPI0021C7E2B9|nr:acyltransferase [Streptomyces sp. FIT100]UUN30727.1 acyltransferase [Streptomyces sp. FIT100]